MAEAITVTIPDLPLIAQASGDELIAVWVENRLNKISQASLRGTRTYSDESDPPTAASVIMQMRPIIGDRWRNVLTGDEWKVTSLQPFTWAPDGNVKGENGISDAPGPPGKPGERGLRGERGPQGGDGNQATRIAATAIPANCNVVDVGNNQCVPMDYTNPSHFGKLIGLVVAATPQGATAVIVMTGPVFGVSGFFTTNDPLYAAANGALTNIPPPYGFRQFLGTATSPSSILYKPDTARLYDPSSPLALLTPSAFAVFLRSAFLALPTTPDGLASGMPWRNGDGISFVP